MENINWYPGHMKKTRELILANLKLVDVVVEVCDARIPVSSRNPIIDELIGSKMRVLCLNKSDLSDEDATREWIEYYRKNEMKNLRMVMPLNCMLGDGVKSLLSKLERIEAKRKQIRIMIVGVPNSGKSSLINRLTGKKSTAIGDRPGITRGKQWLTLQNGMQLLDTPGILWPKFEDPNVGLNLAFCGSIRDEVMDISELGLELTRLLADEYPQLLAERYGIEIDAAEDNGNNPDDYDDYDSFIEAQTNDKGLTIMGLIATKRGYILPGKKIDYERTARMLLDEFRAGKIGRISLERPSILTEKIEEE